MRRCLWLAQVHSRYLAPAVASLPAAAELFASDDVVLRLHPQAAVTWDERGSAAAAELRAASAALPARADVAAAL